MDCPTITPQTSATRRSLLSTRRAVCAAIGGAMAAVLIVAATLSADQRGHGTHEQFGLPPCSMMQFTGIPCPSCGMTTAFAHAAHGQFIAAFIVQPVGALLALGCMVGVAVCAWVVWTNAPIERRIEPWLRWRTVAVLAAVVGLGWLYKIIIESGAQG